MNLTQYLQVYPDTIKDIFRLKSLAAISPQPFLHTSTRSVGEYLWTLSVSVTHREGELNGHTEDVFTLIGSNGNDGSEPTDLWGILDDIVMLAVNRVDHIVEHEYEQEPPEPCYE